MQFGFRGQMIGCIEARRDTPEAPKLKRPRFKSSPEILWRILTFHIASLKYQVTARTSRNPTKTTGWSWRAFSNNGLCAVR
jgi:hypothetical protein